MTANTNFGPPRRDTGSTATLELNGHHVRVVLENSKHGPRLEIVPLDCNLEGEEPCLYYLAPPERCPRCNSDDLSVWSEDPDTDQGDHAECSKCGWTASYLPTP